MGKIHNNGFFQCKIREYRKQGAVKPETKQIQNFINTNLQTTLFKSSNNMRIC